MRGDITKKILEIISEGAIATSDIILAILESGYGASYSRLHSNITQRETARTYRKIRQEEKQKFYSLLSKFKSEGLINSKKEKWSVTNKGKIKIQELANQTFIVRFPPRYYSIEKDGKVRIVIFDIPEQDKKKREWLRSVLVSLDYSLLQKSVWIGKTKIPEKLMEDIRDLKLLKFIHIFTIEKSGSINF